MTTQERILSIYESRQNRATHPEGRFDNAGRWYPAQAEQCSCCDSIRTPSRAWPFSLMLHCRTKKHIANLVVKEVS